MSAPSIKNDLKNALEELFSGAETAGKILVVGCSTSEILGKKIGTSGDISPAEDIFSVLFEETSKRKMSN